MSTKIAVVDVNLVLNSSPHAKSAQAEIAKAQEIYQHNLNVIRDILAKYNNKEQGKAYFLEAGRQLQKQMVASRTAVEQAMARTLNQVVGAVAGEFDIVLPKSLAIKVADFLDISALAQESFDKADITWPPLPQTIDNPKLPPDTMADAPKEQ